MTLILAHDQSANDNFKAVSMRFGSGAVTRQTSWTTIAGILLAWVVPRPLAAVLGAGPPGTLLLF